MIKTLLAPYEIYIWAALAFLLLCGSIYTVYRLEEIGVNRQKAADAKLAAAQIVHKDEVEKHAQELISASNSQLHAALVAPNPKPDVSVRVCPGAAPARLGVSADGTAVGGIALRQPTLPGPVGSDGTGQGMDIAPDTVGLLKRAQAEIDYWRKYYATCKAEGACK